MESRADCEGSKNGSLTPVATADDFPTPILKTRDDADSLKESIREDPFAISSHRDDRTSREYTCLTPPKRSRPSAQHSPVQEVYYPELGIKRLKERSKPRPVPSYTDPDQPTDSILPPFNPDDIDGVPIDEPEPGMVHPGKRCSTIILPTIANRPLVRRATDFPMAPPSDEHEPSPRSAAVILETVLGIAARDCKDPVALWKERRNEFKCPLCLDVLVRPVDVAGCGHLVCRTHVIDLYQFCGSTAGIRCPVCRKEDRVEDFNKIHINQDKWRLIQRAQFHSSRRKSTSPSRSLTPLRDRFNRKFLQDNDF